MTRPLRSFAAAAERIGLDVRSPPLPEQGTRELRNATRAFNVMHERLRRFVDDRTMMLAAISHDLRTMLTRLKLRAEFIDDAEQQAKAISDLDEMQAMLDSTLPLPVTMPPKNRVPRPTSPPSYRASAMTWRMPDNRFHARPMAALPMSVRRARSNAPSRISWSMRSSTVSRPR
jgi:hypothetical protein